MAWDFACQASRALRLPDGTLVPRGPPSATLPCALAFGDDTFSKVDALPLVIWRSRVLVLALLLRAGRAR
jgi:hypothetical protein